MNICSCQAQAASTLRIEQGPLYPDYLQTDTRIYLEFYFYLLVNYLKKSINRMSESAEYTKANLPGFAQTIYVQTIKSSRVVSLISFIKDDV